MNPMDFRRVVAETMSFKTKGLPMHLEWLTFGLLHCDGVSSSELSLALDAATVALGEEVVGCYIEYDPSHPQQTPFIGVAAYKQGARLVVKTYPVRVLGNTMLCNGKSLTLQEGSPGLFLATTWLARSVFGVAAQYKPIPLLATKDACCSSSTTKTQSLRQLAFDRPVVLANALHQLDVAVWSALANTVEPRSTVTAVDMLYCYGLVYTGSLNEMASAQEAERVEALVPDDTVMAYWLEDATVFHKDNYNLVMRLQGPGGEQPQKGQDNTAFYITRRLILTPDGTRLMDTQTKSLSPPFVLEEHRPSPEGLNAFSAWAQSLLPSPFHRKPLPYLRSEVVGGFLQCIHPSTSLAIRPFLVNGEVGDASSLHVPGTVPPRLIFSPDTFFYRGRVPEGTKPSTVHFQIHFKSWVDDPDFQLFLKVAGDRTHIYKIVFPTKDNKDRERVPEPGQLRTFVKSGAAGKLSVDGLSLSVLRPTRGRDWDTDTVEFTVTTHNRPFSVCTNSLVCDFTVQSTLFPYDAASPPRPNPKVRVPIFSTEALKKQQKYGVSLDKAIGKVLAQQQSKRVFTSLYEAKLLGDKYVFFFWDGLDFQMN
jgi:hypothetical protein